MSAILSMLHPPTVIVPKGRVIKLMNLAQTIPTGKPSIAKPKEEINREYYNANRARLIEKQRAKRTAAKDAYVRRSGRRV